MQYLKIICIPGLPRDSGMKQFSSIFPDGFLAGGGPRLSEISCTYDPPIYDITSGFRVAALFSREAQRWTPSAIWFLRYFNPKADRIMYLEYREC